MISIERRYRLAFLILEPFCLAAKMQDEAVRHRSIKHLLLVSSVRLELTLTLGLGYLNSIQRLIMAKYTRPRSISTGSRSR